MNRRSISALAVIGDVISIVILALIAMFIILILHSLVYGQSLDARSIGFRPSYDSIHVKYKDVSLNGTQPGVLFSIKMNEFFQYSLSYQDIGSQSIKIDSPLLIEDSLIGPKKSDRDGEFIDFGMVKGLHHQISANYPVRLLSPFVMVRPYFIFQYHELVFDVSGPDASDTAKQDEVLSLSHTERAALFSIGGQARLILSPNLVFETIAAIGTKQNLYLNFDLSTQLPYYQSFLSLGLNYNKFKNSDSFTYSTFGPYFNVGLRF